MLTTNIDISDCLMNPQIGMTSGFQYNSSHNAYTIDVKFNDDDTNAGLKPKHENNVLIKMVETSFQVTSANNSASVKRTQFPLFLALACTVHKVQGLTLPCAVVSCKLRKQLVLFSRGQIYVALCRLKSFSNLIIKGDVLLKSMKLDPEVKIEHDRLRSQCQIDLEYPILPSAFSLVFLNIRSSARRALDLATYATLISANAVFFNRDTTFRFFQF